MSTGSFIDMLRGGDYLILDTETTGLDRRAEICQIAIIDSSGQTLLDTLVKPTLDIPPGATNVHGITNRMVAAALNWPVVVRDVEEIVAGRNVVIYNMDYDLPIMEQSGAAHNLPRANWHNKAKFWCAMLAFAPIYGDWNTYRQNYKWQKLTTAAAFYNVPTVNAHNALGDCLMTLGVCRAMAAVS